MFKGFLSLIFVVSLLMMMSCEPVLTDKLGTVDIPNIDSGVVVDNSTNIIKLPENFSLIGKSSSEIEKELDSSPWIFPGKVRISNLYSGSQAEWMLRIHNEKEVPTTFLVVGRNPDYTEKGYEVLPFSWIIVDAPGGKITIAPKSVGNVLITIKFNSSDKASAKKYETWISVTDISQSGMIRTELCSRWFIDTQ